MCDVDSTDFHVGSGCSIEEPMSAGEALRLAGLAERWECER